MSTLSGQPAATSEEYLQPEDDLERSRLQTPLKGSRLPPKRAIFVRPQGLASARFVVSPEGSPSPRERRCRRDPFLFICRFCSRGFRLRERSVGDQRFSEDIDLFSGGGRLVALGLQVPFEIFTPDLYVAPELHGGYLPA